MGLFDFLKPTPVSTPKRPAPPQPKPVLKREPAAPRSGVDCYAYGGKVEDYFADVLQRNFPGYELRRNVAVEDISSPGKDRSASPLSSATNWKCDSCGSVNTGKFCPGCGSKKPEPKPVPAASGPWRCPKCGSECAGKFCMECGTPRPVSHEWVCSCGTVNKGKFCPECGSGRPAAPAAVKTAAAVSSAPVKSQYPLLTHVLYQNGKPQLAIYVCSKKEYDRNQSCLAMNQMERACRNKSIAFQRYFREFRNDEAYIRSRVSDDLS